MTLLEAPAFVDAGNPLTTSVVAAAALTVIGVCVPLIPALTVSVAVIDWGPAVRRTTPLNDFVPLSPRTNV